MNNNIRICAWFELVPIGWGSGGINKAKSNKKIKYACGE